MQLARAIIAAVLCLTLTEAHSQEKPDESELNKVLQKLKAEKAPASQGNTAEAKQLCDMLAMVMGMAAPKIPLAEGKPAPRTGQRNYLHLNDSGDRCAVLIHREGIDQLTEEKRDHFLGMCVGMSQGAAARVDSVKILAVAVVWNGKIQWANVSNTESEDKLDKSIDDPAKARAAMLPFFTAGDGK